MITLLESAARTASDVAAVSGINRLSSLKAAVFYLGVSAAATESGDTLDVYIQHSPDAGTTWDDFVHFTQVLGNGGAKQFIATWTRDIAPTSALKPPADASLTAGVQQGPVSPLWRVKWVIVDASADNASFTFSVTVSPLIER
jgi:hypothetical protein